MKKNYIYIKKKTTKEKTKNNNLKTKYKTKQNKTKRQKTKTNSTILSSAGLLWSVLYLKTEKIVFSTTYNSYFCIDRLYFQILVTIFSSANMSYRTRCCRSLIVKGFGINTLLSQDYRVNSGINSTASFTELLQCGTV